MIQVNVIRLVLLTTHNSTIGNKNHKFNMIGDKQSNTINNLTNTLQNHWNKHIKSSFIYSKQKQQVLTPKFRK